MKILFVLPEYKPFPGGGLATYYINLLNEFINNGHEIDVIVGNAFNFGCLDFVNLFLGGRLQKIYK